MQLRKRISHLFQPKVLVLMYHRIAELKIDPWQLAVSPKNFEQHLQVLQKTGKLLSVKEMVLALQNKELPNNSICVTFDDAYADNYLQAKPLLEKYQCPAIFFIPTHYIGQQKQFWWDELESIMLQYPQLPAKFSLPLNDTLFDYDLQEDNVLTNDQLKKHEAWAWPALPPTRRCELYLSIWEKIRPLPYGDLQKVLQHIKSWASFTQPIGSENVPMSHEQLSELTTHSLIDLGLHTGTHPALAYHSEQTQHTEINGNKEYLENICGRPVETLAYPYGSYNDATLAVAKKLGLTAAFTTSEKIVSNLTDPLQAGRFQVRNWNGSDFGKQILHWKTSAQFL